MKILISAIALIALCFGCSVLEPVADNTRFFVLTAESAQSTAETIDAGELVIAIGPVRIPAYLNNPWIAVRRGSVEIVYSDSHQWGEPVGQGIQRTIRDNLRLLLGAADISIMQPSRRGDSRYVITLNFSRFELTDQGEAILNASWRITNTAAEEFVRIGTFETKVSFDNLNGRYDSGVTALSETLARLCQELVADLEAR